VASIVRGVKGSLQLRHLSEPYSTDITFYIVPKRGLYRGWVAWCCGVRNALSRLIFPWSFMLVCL